MAGPFRDRSHLTKRSLFARLAARPSPHAAVAEVETLLATKGPESVGTGDVHAVYTRHRVPAPEQQTLSARLYESALTVFASDNVISVDEARYLRVLRDVLNLPEASLREAETAILYPRFRAIADATVADGRVTPDEEAELSRLGAALGVPASQCETPLLDARRAHVRAVLDEAVADERLSPVERARIDATAAALDISVMDAVFIQITESGT